MDWREKKVATKIMMICLVFGALILGRYAHEIASTELNKPYASQKEVIVNIGDCNYQVFKSEIKCQKGRISGYFLFPQKIVSRTVTREGTTIYIVNSEIAPNGCYRPFEVEWSGDISKIEFAIEINGRTAARSTIDVRTCHFTK